MIEKEYKITGYSEDAVKISSFDDDGVMSITTGENGISI